MKVVSSEALTKLIQLSKDEFLSKNNTTTVTTSGLKTINGESILGTGDIDTTKLPDQTGQSGKFLTTNGTSASWNYTPTNKIGEIIQVACTSSYVPDGCLPCDGQEYAKSQFSDLWTNFLTSNPAKLNVCTYEQYQSDISTYGQCGKFAVDTTNQKFKAPTIKDGSYLTQAKSDTELGKAYNESLPNHTHTISSSNGLFLGNAAGGWANNLNGTGQTNTTGGASSSTYQDGAKVQGDNIRVRFFVVVSNGQINQSQMDWSQWASSLSGKANTDLSNTGNIAQSFINTVLTWGIPDYSAGIDIKTTLYNNKSYTAPTKGVLFNAMIPTNNSEIKINGYSVGVRSYSTYGNWIPTPYYLDAGDIFSVSGWTNSQGGAYFFPLKGAK